MNKYIGIGLLLWVTWQVCPSYADEAAEKAALAAAPSWLSQIDAGNYSNSWRDASAYFKGVVTENGFRDVLSRARKPLGKLLSRQLAKAQSSTSLPGAPDGNYVVMQFDTSFANKNQAVETVTFMREKDGKWKAAGYFIK